MRSLIEVSIARLGVFFACIAVVDDEIAKFVFLHEAFFVGRKISAGVERKEHFAAHHPARALRAL